MPGSVDWLEGLGSPAKPDQGDGPLALSVAARTAGTQSGLPVLRAGPGASGSRLARALRPPTGPGRDLRGSGASSGTVCLAAANWRRVGESKSRGRDDRQRQKAQSPKDLWVYEWDDRARPQLQAYRGKAGAPFGLCAACRTDWVEEELAGVELGDQRLNRSGSGHVRRAGRDRRTAFTAASTLRRRPKGPINWWKTPARKSRWRVCWRPMSCKPPAGWRRRRSCSRPRTPPP